MSEDKKLTSEKAFEKWLEHSDLLEGEQSQQVQSNLETSED